MSTASANQAFALRSSFFQHLSFKAFIGVEIVSSPLAMFDLSFHLPFYAGRRSPQPQEDHRRDANNKPLRKAIDVSFLSPRDDESLNYFYEGQVSCTISGVNAFIWVAYCFVDTYFDRGSEERETLRKYHEEREGEEGDNMDPLTKGTQPANYPIWDPRAYFLIVLRSRLVQVTREWERVVTMVDDRFHDKAKVCSPASHVSL